MYWQEKLWYELVDLQPERDDADLPDNDFVTFLSKGWYSGRIVHKQNEQICV